MEFLRHPGWLHLSALFTALILGTGLVQTGWINEWVFPSPPSIEVSALSGNAQGQIGTWTSPNQELMVRQALKESILLVGSSELTQRQQPQIPYRFFNEQLGYPLLAFGQGGHQCYNIFSSLGAMSEHLPNARLVIVLSTGWFAGSSAEGTSTDMFLKYHNERILAYLDRNPSFPDSLRHFTNDFVGQHYSEIGNPGPYLRKQYYQYQQAKSPLHQVVFAPFVSGYSSICDWMYAKRKKQYEDGSIALDFDPASALALLPKNQELALPDPPKWKLMLEASIAEAKTASTSNDLGVNDDYFGKYLANHPGRKVKPVAIENNQEFKDFEALLALLQHHNTQTLFVMQSLHPSVYRRLDEMDGTIATLKTKVEEAGFSFLDLHTSDPEAYQVGTLTDIMHSGPYGWMQVNQAIYETFLSSEQQ